jgi:hypothetical protein
MSGVDIQDVNRPRRRIGLIASVMVIVTMFAGVLVAAKAYGGKYDEWAASPEAPARVYVTGDSVTYWTAPYIHADHPWWQIEGVPGRQVQQLGIQLAQILEVDPTPRIIIVELGTNTAGWEDYHALYTTALAQLPESTHVILVTPYRDGVKFSRTSDYADNLQAYHQYWEAKAMRQIVLERPNTSLVRWRYVARYNPDLLHDGIHPNLRGREVLSGLMTKAVAQLR